MSIQSSGGDYQMQDGQVLTVETEGNRPHAQWRFERRAPPEWRNESVLVVWRCAEPIDYPSCNSDAEYARYHPPTGLVLIGCYGMLRTVLRLADRPEQEQEFVRRQVGGES